MASHLFVVVSGAPASGKSSVAATLAARLAWPFLDKDAFLERHFEAIGSPDPDARRRLSRASDRELERTARGFEHAVLCSFWRPRDAASDSGTQTHWLCEPTVRVLEITCRCPPEVSASRFLARNRHPGHHDQRHSFESLVRQAQEVDARLPLGIGPSIELDTSQPVELDSVVRTVTRWAAD